MSKQEGFHDLPLGPPSGSKELWRWLRDELRSAILNGRLKRGARMPSSRGLARQYQCSRGTVVMAFEHLRAEGYIEGRKGTGTFVGLALPDDSLSASRPAIHLKRQVSRAGISKRGRIATEHVQTLPASRSIGKAFRSYEPAIDLFPVEVWSRISARVVRKAPRSLYGQGDALGYAPLRKAIAEYVGSTRGVRCEPGQVLVTAGTQQALDLIGRLLLDTGDGVFMEDPGYPGAVHAFRAAGARIIPISVDPEGPRIDLVRRQRQKAKLAYTTPANQFPLGITISLPRRLQLLNWAIAEGAWIVEDEYDAEYRYFGRPVPALQSLDESGSVIYIGTFTKMLFNSLRLGFVVLPDRVVDTFAAARSLSDRHPPTIQQAILAEFILEGYFSHHVRRMRQVYAERASILVEAAKRRLGGVIDVVHPGSGMRTIGWVRTGEHDLDLADRARSQGLELAALSQFTLRHSPPDGLVLGFAGCAPAELRSGVDILAAIVASNTPVHTAAPFRRVSKSNN
jgi:GntR family transcriptional regulator / MocR family aminotransferase